MAPPSPPPPRRRRRRSKTVDELEKTPAASRVEESGSGLPPRSKKRDSRARVWGKDRGRKANLRRRRVRSGVRVRNREGRPRSGARTKISSFFRCGSIARVSYSTFPDQRSYLKERLSIFLVRYIDVACDGCSTFNSESVY